MRFRTPPPISPSSAARFSARRDRAAAVATWICSICLGAAGTGYVNDFSAAEVGKPPADVQVAGGVFIVAERDGNKFLELPGEPLDTFGLLFGPAQGAETNVGVRVQSESTGRRFPEFGVGAGDIGGYRLMVLPGQKKLQLRKGEDPLADAEFPAPWTSGKWTELRLRVRKTDGAKWTVEGKAWPAGTPEPQAWPVSFEAATPPPPGRASIWAVPFSGKAIRFDDLKVG
jgi:hypothetical protein